MCFPDMVRSVSFIRTTTICCLYLALIRGENGESDRRRPSIEPSIAIFTSHGVKSYESSQWAQTHRKKRHQRCSFACAAPRLLFNLSCPLDRVSRTTQRQSSIFFFLTERSRRIWKVPDENWAAIAPESIRRTRCLLPLFARASRTRTRAAWPVSPWGAHA